MSDNASKPVYPEIERVSLTEALEDLHSWVNDLDMDGLAQMLSQHYPCWEGKAVVVFDDQGGGDDSNPYCEGKEQRLVCIPVEEVKS